MKRCPECQFLYEDESTTCDMDGTALRYTVHLPKLPGLAQSIWDKWTIAMLFAVVVVTVLVILYRATPAAYTSSTGGQMTPVNKETVVDQDRPSADAATSPESSAEQPAADDNSTDSRDPFEAPSNGAAAKGPKSKRGSQAEEEKEPTPAPFIHIQAAPNSPAVNGSSGATQSPRTETYPAQTSAGQKVLANAGTSTTSNHPLPPAASINKANTEAKKESGVKSFFKKAGKVLKKPFGEN